MLRTRRQSGHDRMEPESPSWAGWLTLVASLPTDDAATRMKALRTLEALGAGVLREGVYLLPDHEQHRMSLARLAEYIDSVGGHAWMLAADTTDSMQDATFRRLFDRTPRYLELQKNIAAMKTGFGIADPGAIATLVQRHREELETLAAIDFFPSASRDLTARLLAETERAVDALRFPADQPESTPVAKSRKDYFRKTWATRHPLTIDRLAAAWLIRRFIDPEAKMVWLDKHAAPPDEAATFGFEGAEFASSRARVTFEELIQSFRLHRHMVLERMGTLVKALELGDVSVAEAQGVETMLTGARHRAKTDDELLIETEKTLDLVFETYGESTGSRKRSPEKA